ncbi:MAG: type IV secretion system DNA-binding domain-containing protein [Acidiferrobacter sp.]
MIIRIKHVVIRAALASFLASAAAIIAAITVFGTGAVYSHLNAVLRATPPILALAVGIYHVFHPIWNAHDNFAVGLLATSTLGMIVGFPFALGWSAWREVMDVRRDTARRDRLALTAAQAPQKPGGLAVRSDVRTGPRTAIPDGVLAQHVLLVGGTGAGKSQVLRAAAIHARKTGAPAIIPAVEDSLFQALYDPDKDTILCPWDVRSVDWSPLSEIQNTDTDPAMLASCLIKKAQGESETWAAYARTLLSAMIKRTVEEGGNMADLLHHFKDDEALQEALEDMPGESLLREGNERMMGSVIGTADAGAGILRDVARDLSAEEGWGVRRWIDEQIKLTDAGKPAGFLWILLGETVRDKMEPIVTVALTIAARAILSSTERRDRRFYMFVDEVSSFPPLPSFQSMLARGRKYGLSVWMGLQGVPQFQETYGQYGAASLLSCLSTQVLFRTADAESAKWASDLIGTRHMTRESHSTSSSEGNAMTGQGGSSGSSVSESHVIEHAVLPSEIAGLPDMRAYLRICGRASDVILTDINYVPLESQCEAFIPIAQKRRAKRVVAPVGDEGMESGVENQTEIQTESQTEGQSEGESVKGVDKNRGDLVKKIMRRAGIPTSSAPIEAEGVVVETEDVDVP